LRLNLPPVVLSEYTRPLAPLCFLLLSLSGQLFT
jgi:hypothetical protein